MKKIITLLFLVWALIGYSNNLQISNLTLGTIDNAQGYAMVTFDISWENSWRDAENWDAIWVFIKFNDGSGWQHAEINYMDGTTDGHSAPTGSSITTPSDGMGIFIYRSANGSGAVNYSTVELRWNYGNNGILILNGIDLRVMGIEMVYVPEGSFWIGDGETTNVQGHFESGTSGAAFQVNSEAAITLGGGNTGSLGNNNGVNMSNNGDFIPSSYNTISFDDFNDSQTQTLPANFPKGYQGFYCMKYELTQGQYVEFLNMLTAAQSSTRFDPNPHATIVESDVRYNLTGTYPNITTTTPHVTAMFVEYFDGAAYADWVGLRPMSEMEFEKACRGTAVPVTGEYAWGTTDLNATFPTMINLGDIDEGMATGFSITLGNAWYDNVNPLGAAVRVGLFAANANNINRETAGATYWGIMEMSGNCWERAITVGRPEGRSFEGTHGDGVLTTSGNATNIDWPGHSGADGVDDVIGAGYRGAGFEFPTPVVSNMRISARRMATSFYDIRYYDDTMRMVRTSPL